MAEQNTPSFTNQSAIAPKTIKNQEATFGKNELLDSKQILSEMLGIKTGHRVADLGAGGGLFTLQSAKLVGDQGEVYSVDVLKNILSDIDSKARMAKLYNIKTIWSDLEIAGATKVPANTLDFALLVNILFQSKKHTEIISEAVRLLKTGGKLLIIDWSDTKPGFTPNQSMQVDPNKLIASSQIMNLVLEKQFEAGKYHFGLIFIKR